MIEIKRVSYTYAKGRKPALREINARIPEGIHVLVGENGAGKTTMLHILAGLLTPVHGKAEIDGTPANSNKPSEMGRAFFMEENTLFPAKNIREFAKQHSRLYPGFSEEVFNENLKAFQLTGNESLRKASLGNRKKAQLAYALALGVDVLLLDEPTNALDIQSKEVLRRLIASVLMPSQTVIVSTHTLSELENLFEGMIAIHDGELLIAAKSEDITDKVSFYNSRILDKESYYAENRAGGYAMIGPYAGDDTRIDWEMLYRALFSPASCKIIDAIDKEQ